MQLVFDKTEVAEMLGVSTKTIDQYEQDGLLHRLEKFDRPRYSINEIEILTGQKGKPPSVRIYEGLLAEKDEIIQELQNKIQDIRNMCF